MPVEFHDHTYNEAVAPPEFARVIAESRRRDLEHFARHPFIAGYWRQPIYGEFWPDFIGEVPQPQVVYVLRPQGPDGVRDRQAVM